MSMFTYFWNSGETNIYTIHKQSEGVLEKLQIYQKTSELELFLQK